MGVPPHRRLDWRPQIDEEAVWRAALSGAASLFVLILSVAVLLPLRDDLNPATAALVLLLPPLIATNANRTLSLALAVVTAAVFNFFFTQPYESFRIEDSSSVAAFLVYVVVAVTMSAVVSRLRAARQTAEQRTRSMELLQDLTVELIRNEQLAPTVRSTLRSLVDGLGLRGAALHASADGIVLDAEAGDSAHAAGVIASLGTPDVPTLVNLRGDAGTATVPILTTNAVYGFVAADAHQNGFEQEEIRVLESFAGVIGLALGRATLAREALRTQALEETDRLRQALLQSVSHDLRTPLTAIKASAYALRTHPSEREHEALCRDIEQHADRLYRLVGTMLDLSRIEAGALRPQRTVMPVDELVHAAADDAEPATVGHDVPIDVEDDLPPVSVDETMLRQVLVNLLENAARADVDGQPITVRAARLADDRLALAVIDHGPGVPEAERRRIFEPYYRLRPGSQNGGGTGLGLALSHGFVEAHGGALRVEPTPGGGATFVVELPFGEGA